MFGTNNGIAGQVLVGFGTDEQKKQWLQRIASGEWWRRSRSPNRAPDRTLPGCAPGRAATATSWVINGQKRFITNAPIADLFVIFARTAEPATREPGHLGVPGPRGRARA